MRFLVLLVGSTLVGAAACGSGEKSSTQTGAPAGGTLIIPTLGEPADILPPYVNELNGRRVQDLIFEHLAEIDSTLNTLDDKTFSPRLAQKWAWAPDSMSIAFSINPAARWHDGKPVTANDVRYSFNTFVDPKVGSPSASLMANIDSISVRDSLTAVVFFKKRTPEQFYDVAYQLVVFPEHVYGSIPATQLRTDPKSRMAIGSGRFRLVRWEPGTRLELISDTANYRGRAKLDRLIFVPTDAPAGVAQILSGQADVMEAFPIDQVSKLDSNQFARPVVVPQLGYVFLGMNRFARKSKTAPHPLFSDARLRRALSMSVDRNALATNVFGDGGKPSHGPFAMTAAFADGTLSPPPYDTIAAGAMFDSSGWRRGKDGMREKNGKPLRFSMAVSPSSFRRKYSVLLQAQFRTAGAQVEIEQLDQDAFLAERSTNDFDAIIDGFNPDPSVTGLKQSWATAGFPPEGQNVLRYSNKTVDALIDSASASFDPAKAKAYASRAFRIILGDMPAIWLYDISFKNGVNRRVSVATLRPDEWWVNLPDWSIPIDKRIDRDRIGLSQPKP